MLSAIVCWLTGHDRAPCRAPFFHCHRCGKFFDPRAALLVSNRSGVEDLKHDLDRYMKIANIECNRAEKLQEALGVSLAALESVMRDEYDVFYTKVREAADIARNALDTENSEDHMSREG